MTPEQIATAMPQIEAHVRLGLLAFPAKQVGGTKQPAYKGWQTRRWDIGMLEAELERVPYYGLTQPKDNPRRLVILDLDDGRAGLQPGATPWRDRWEALHGTPDTKMTATPSGGAHAWFIWPDDVPLPGGSWHGFTVRKLHGAKHWAAGPGSVRPDGVPYLDLYPGRAIATMPADLARAGMPRKTVATAPTPDAPMDSHDEIMSWLGTIARGARVSAPVYLAMLQAAKRDGLIVDRDPAWPWTDDDFRTFAEAAEQWPVETITVVTRPALVTGVTDVTDTGRVRGDLAEALDELLAHLRRFVWFSKPEQAVAVALWVAHTHAMDAVEQSPILSIHSPVKQSGKSRLLDVIETVVPVPWRIERPSEAVLYRRIERDHPTILLDEADTIFSDRAGQFEGIRAVFNAGNRRGTVVSRVMPKGKTFDLVDFTIFGPKAIAGIGRFPETIVDRSIVIAMTRRGPSDSVERLRSKRAAELGSPICDSLSSTLGGVGGLSLADADLPAELDDRGQDNWEALLALADLAGGDWPMAARNATIVLQRDRSSADDNAAVTLLTDLRAIYGDESFMTTSALLEQLHALESSPWSEWRAGKPMTARGLARLLDPFGIAPDRTRTVRGYNRRAFDDAWSRFLPSTPPASVTSVTPVTDGVDLYAEAHRIFADDHMEAALVRPR